MRYNVYLKHHTFIQCTAVYVKKSINNCHFYEFINIKYLNDEYHANNYTKISFNIFEAKQFIDKQKDLNKQNYQANDFTYWIEEVKY